MNLMESIMEWRRFRNWEWSNLSFAFRFVGYGRPAGNAPQRRRKRKEREIAEWTKKREWSQWMERQAAIGERKSLIWLNQLSGSGMELTKWRGEER